ncbi:MAG TPA: acyl-CoA dehydrogenase family protein [Hyphomicrobiaceae bacterium]|jgi:alkylation response protein AidB-like acyl-CoA dehydrogenase|nr:acyl-CoA dehydrogenase family protein [Hyphomicrobiaceae bacterium]
MDFEDTPGEAEFRAGVRAFLGKAAKPRAPGTGMVYRAGNEDPAFRAQAKAWQASKAEAGYAGITWPTHWGGRGGTPIQQVIYDQEEANYAVPRGLFDIGLGMCIPTLCTWGTQEHRDRFAGKALRGEEIWCQLFSEPAAGSDLAGLRTRAEADGSDWVINGEKIWTSGAHYCDYGVLVTRSDFSARKHDGLTYFFLDMKSPGIEIRPIKQMSGASHFNQVFFKDVRIPDSQRLGAVGQGWKVALTTLMNERYTIGGRMGAGVEDVFELARRLEIGDGPALKHGAVRDKLADWYVASQGLKYANFRAMTALSRGETPGPEASLGKLVNASMLQTIAAFAMDLMDEGGVLCDPELAPLAAAFQQTLLTSPASRIAGGSDEIMRNIIAERVLGLPAEVRLDKTLPFNQLPTGKR